MKKIFLFIFLSVIILGLSGCGNKNSTERYDEILKSFKDAVDWQLKVTDPSACKNNEQGDVEIAHRFKILDDVLIDNGYLKKSDMLDVDKKSYCKAYAETDCDGDELVYKTYLRCKDFTTAGYVE
ncbi:MAG: hypothetical protein J1F35_04075 [Erysipelotrichales bacterium]|nr:hypothetical protein [Erysipelotrichales bacterium]